jgi:hypothetical protein
MPALLLSGLAAPPSTLSAETVPATGIAASVFPIDALAATDTLTSPPPPPARAVQIRPAPGPSEIDGHMDDAGWQGAASR